MNLKLNKIQRIALYSYFFSLNFEVFNIAGIGSTAKITGILYIISVLYRISDFTQTSNIKLYLRIIFLFWFYLSLVSFVFAIFNDVPNIKGYFFSIFDLSILLNIIFFWLLINHDRLDPGIIVKGLFSFSIGTIVLTILYYFGYGIESDGGRISIFGDNENIIGIRLSMSSIILLYSVISNQFSFNKLRILLLIPIPFMLNFMFQTGSRVAFISFVLCFTIGVILYKTKKIRYKLLLLLLSSGFFIYLFYSIEHSVIILDRLNNTIQHGHLSGREKIWANILSLVANNFIFGVGKTGYQFYMYNIYGTDKSPHNVIMEIFAYTGIIGLGIYIFFLFKITFQAWKIYYKNGILLPFLLMIPVYGVILSAQALNVKIIWAIFSFSVSSIFYKKINYCSGIK